MGKTDYPPPLPFLPEKLVNYDINERRSFEWSPDFASLLINVPANVSFMIIYIEAFSLYICRFRASDRQV